MRISEIFYSIQGEGGLAGVPSVFVRLAGCPLRCRWCDTNYAQDRTAGKDYTIEQIIRLVKQWRCGFAIITGGEPMVQADLPQLTQKLKADEKHITVETAGIAFTPALACDLMSISPKLSNSANNSEPDVNVLRNLIDSYDYQIKFVVDSEEDIAEINSVIEKIGSVDLKKVMLMPQAKTRDEL